VIVVQVRLRACLDRCGDFLHARVAGRLGEHPARHEDAVQHGEGASAQR
jgi:hypothetical protein